MFQYKINSPYVFFESQDFSKVYYDVFGNQPWEDSPALVWLSIEPGRWLTEHEYFEEEYEAGPALIWSVKYGACGRLIVMVEGKIVSLEELSDLINKRREVLMEYYKDSERDEFNMEED